MGTANREEEGLARPERLELPTPWFVARYSIQLSYGRVRKRDYSPLATVNHTTERERRENRRTAPRRRVGAARAQVRRMGVFGLGSTLWEPAQSPARSRSTAASIVSTERQNAKRR